MKRNYFDLSLIEILHIVLIVSLVLVLIKLFA